MHDLLSQKLDLYTVIYGTQNICYQVNIYKVYEIDIIDLTLCVYTALLISDGIRQCRRKSRRDIA